MGGGRVVTTALVVVPGPDETVVFVRQKRGPYAGHWLLPGGKVEFGEQIVEAARREGVEESGCELGDLKLVGAYEITGPGHHFVMWAYRSDPVLAPVRAHAADVGGVLQARWDSLEPHPTDMPILNDANVADYKRDRIEELLRREGIRMGNLFTGELFGDGAYA